MVILVRCTDQTVTVALASQLDILIGEGLITEYLGCDGWVAVAARCKKPCALPYCAPVVKSRCTAFVSCF